MKERLFSKGIVSTVIGILFMFAALYSYLFRGAPIVEVSVLTTVGFVFLRAKDSILGLKNEE